MNLKHSTVTAAILAIPFAPAAIADTPASVVSYSGMCDASAAVPVGPSLFGRQRRRQHAESL